MGETELLPILALIAITATAPQMSSGLTRAPSTPPEASEGVTVVYLGCQVQNTSLSDCKVVNRDPVEPGAAAMALKLASGMSVPQALADRQGDRIVVKLNVKQ